MIIIVIEIKIKITKIELRPPPDRQKFALFSPSPVTIFNLSSLSWGSPRTASPFGAHPSGRSCSSLANSTLGKTRATTKGGGRGGKLKMQVKGSAALAPRGFKHHQNSREDPQRGKKRTNYEAGDGKNAKFWAPHPSDHHFFWVWAPGPLLREKKKRKN